MWRASVAGAATVTLGDGWLEAIPAVMEEEEESIARIRCL